jgi:hypothetical protein
MKIPQNNVLLCFQPAEPNQKRAAVLPARRTILSFRLEAESTLTQQRAAVLPASRSILR